MNSYRLYFLHTGSEHVEYFETIDALNDQEAVECVNESAGAQPLELWFEERRVWRFEAGDSLTVAHQRLSPGCEEEHVMDSDQDQPARERAYAIWEREGERTGETEEHWLRAQSELTRETEAQEARKHPAPASITGAGSEGVALPVTKADR